MLVVVAGLLVCCVGEGHTEEREGDQGRNETKGRSKGKAVVRKIRGIRKGKRGTRREEWNGNMRRKCSGIVGKSEGERMDTEGE